MTNRSFGHWEFHWSFGFGHWSFSPHVPKSPPPKALQDFLPDATGNGRRSSASLARPPSFITSREIRTPIFEHSELFHRGVGETTDIVHKETYHLRRPRRSSSLSARKEPPASCAVIENGLVNDAGARAKVYYLGPNFRYERPAAGRLRQSPPVRRRSLRHCRAGTGCRVHPAADGFLPPLRCERPRPAHQQPGRSRKQSSAIATRWSHSSRRKQEQAQRRFAAAT